MLFRSATSRPSRRRRPREGGRTRTGSSRNDLGRRTDHSGEPRHDRQDALLEALFAAYFVEGRDIGDLGVLEDLAAAAGLPDAAVFLAHGDGIEEAKAEDALARRQGINGVPCFIFNGRFLLSGAQEPESFFQLFDLAREDEATALRESAR